jgi:hypothetical protein
MDRVKGAKDFKLHRGTLTQGNLDSIQRLLKLHMYNYNACVVVGKSVFTVRKIIPKRAMLLVALLILTIWRCNSRS